ncbi:hypothetical protein ITP31_003841 [Salmonella enterica]|nr:hypothetical protein [Salmonella enterica]
MADTIKVSGLPPIDTLNKDAIVLVVQDGTTHSATVEQLIALGSKLKSGVSGGNWATNYPDTPSAKNAHGKLGNSEYWKVTIQLRQAPVGIQAVVTDAKIDGSYGIPCDASGNPIPFTIHTGTVRYQTNALAEVDIWLIVHGEATQLMSLNNKQMQPLGLVNDTQYEPHYSMRYFWTE